MRTLLIFLLFLLLKTKAFYFPWEIIDNVDNKNYLDWFQYNVYHLDKNLLPKPNFTNSTKFFTTKNTTSKFHFSLRVISLNISEWTRQTKCSKVSNKGTFIKNPQFSYLLFDEEFESTQQKHARKLENFRCLLPFQPYFYILTRNVSAYKLYEAQMYSKRLVLLATSKLDNITDIQYFNTNVYERRSNFNNQSIFTKEVLEGEECMKDVFALFQRKFNFLPKHENGFTAYGSLAPNGSWKGSIGRLINHDYDIAVGEFTITSERLSVIEPGNPLMMAKTELLYRISNPKGHWKSLTSVLSMDLWLAIFASMMIFLVIFIITSQRKLSLHFISIILQAYLAQNFAEIPFWKVYGSKKKALALTLQLLSFLGAIVFWTYSGCLVSFFAFSHSGPPIQSLGDLQINKVKLKVYGKGATYFSVQKWLIENYGDDGKSAFDASVEPLEGHVRMADIVLGMGHGSARNDFGILAESQSHTRNIKSMNLDPCLFGRHKIPELADKPIGWLYPNNSILRVLFNRYTMELQESGVFHQLEKRHFPKESSCPAIPFHRIDLGTVTIVFVIFLFGFMMALLTFLTEKYRPPIPSKKPAKMYSTKSRILRSSSF